VTDNELAAWRELAHDPDQRITTPIEKADLAELVDEIDNLRALLDRLDAAVVGAVMAEGRM
jgi:hypothetical protein